MHVLTSKGGRADGPLPVAASSDCRGLSRHGVERCRTRFARHEDGKQSMLRVPSRTGRRHGRNMRHLDTCLWRPARKLIGLHEARRHELGERAVVTDPEGFHEHATRVHLDGRDVASPSLEGVAQHDRKRVVVDELDLVRASQHLGGGGTDIALREPTDVRAHAELGDGGGGREGLIEQHLIGPLLLPTERHPDEEDDEVDHAILLWGGGGGVLLTQLGRELLRDARCTLGLRAELRGALFRSVARLLRLAELSLQLGDLGVTCRDQGLGEVGPEGLGLGLPLELGVLGGDIEHETVLQHHRLVELDADLGHGPGVQPLRGRLRLRELDGSQGAVPPHARVAADGDLEDPPLLRGGPAAHAAGVELHTGRRLGPGLRHGTRHEAEGEEQGDDDLTGVVGRHGDLQSCGTMAGGV